MSIIKKCAPKMIFFNEKRNYKDSDDFRHSKFLQTAEDQK